MCQVDDQSRLADLTSNAFSTVHKILEEQRNMIMDRPDRFELYDMQEIIEGKANIKDFQVLIDQLLKQAVLKKNYTLSNLINESSLQSQAHLSRSQISLSNECDQDDDQKSVRDGAQKLIKSAEKQKNGN